MDTTSAFGIKAKVGEIIYLCTFIPTRQVRVTNVYAVTGPHVLNFRGNDTNPPSILIRRRPLLESSFVVLTKQPIPQY